MLKILKFILYSAIGFIVLLIGILLFFGLIPVTYSIGWFLVARVAIRIVFVGLLINAGVERWKKYRLRRAGEEIPEPSAKEKKRAENWGALLAFVMIAVEVVCVMRLVGRMYSCNLAYSPLNRVAQELILYHDQHGSFDQGDDIGAYAMPSDHSGIRRFVLAEKTDYWKRPVQVEIGPNSFTILSLGRDGEPGGIRDAHDIRLSWNADDGELEVEKSNFGP